MMYAQDWEGRSWPSVDDGLRLPFLLSDSMRGNVKLTGGNHD